MNNAEKMGHVITPLKMEEHEQVILQPKSCDDKIFADLLEAGELLCAQVAPENSSFFLIESLQRKAGVIHQLSTVVIFRGMLNFIFRVASLAAAAVPPTGQTSSESTPPWAENVAYWVEEGVFYFDDERYWWLHSRAHRTVFDMYVLSLFRFIVLHELGHLHNMHHARLQARNTQQAVDSGKGCDETKDELSVQVKEVVADTFAFQTLMQMLSEDGKYLDVSDLYISLNSIQTYFWLSDHLPLVRTGFKLDAKKYPPFAFRMQAVESGLLEHGERFISEDLIREVLCAAIERTHNISLNVTGAKDFLSWRMKLSDPLFLLHYQKILLEVPAWANREFREYD